MNILPNQLFLTPEKRPQPDRTKNCKSQLIPPPWLTPTRLAKTLPPSPAASQSLKNLHRQQDQRTQQLLLRQLGTRVKKIIKQNSELRNNTPDSEEVQTLRKEKEQLQAVVDQLRRGEAAREGILSEENLYLREYITRRKGDTAQESQNNHKIQIEQSQKSVNGVITGATQEKAQSLRRYIMEYINTVIQSNDQKLMAQQRYLQTLEKRVGNLGKFQQMAAHLRFQRTVMLQQSNRKSKNFTAGAPTVPGDQILYQPQATDTVPASHQKTNHFAGKSIKTSPKVQSGRDMAALVIRSARLQEELTLLQEKYQAEIQSHIRDCSDRQELVLNIQKLNAEKKDLKHRVGHLEGELEAAKRKVLHLEIAKGGREVLSKANFSIEQQLAEIKKELLSCGVDRYEAVQRQLAQASADRDRYEAIQRELAQLSADRDRYEAVQRQLAQVSADRERLRREMSQLQSQRAEQSRFSTATREIFLLRQKNCQLEQNIQFYLHQIDQYEQQIRRIAQQSEQQLARAISKDFKEIPKGEEGVQGLKWPRMVHRCMVNSIARLQHIQSQLTANTLF